MCGRFNLRSSASSIAQQFLPGVDESTLPVLEPRYNIAPTQPVACVLRREVGGPRRLMLMRWGLIPAWADDLSIGNRLINARCETAAQKPAFRAALKSHRCIIPADGYYEWVSGPDGKQPYEYSRQDGHLLALAGLWERNLKAAADGQELYSCTILTTAANALAAEVHDRMPVVLRESAWDRWLDPAMHDASVLDQMMQPAEEGLLVKRPVSKRLNNVRNQGADLLCTP